MSEQRHDAAKGATDQPWIGSGAQRGAAAEGIGQGPGLDPPSAQPEPDDRVPPGDEAYADRPARGEAPREDEPDDDDWIDGAAIQRPPDDS